MGTLFLLLLASLGANGFMFWLLNRLIDDLVGLVRAGERSERIHRRSAVASDRMQALDRALYRAIGDEVARRRSGGVR